MITKFEKYNESIRSLLVGPTKEEIWKNLGYDRTFDTTEEFFLYVIDGMKMRKQNKYLVFWEKNDKILFEQDLKYKIIWVDYHSIWSIFVNIFGFNYDQTQQFIKKQVEKHLNWKKFTIDHPALF